MQGLPLSTIDVLEHADVQPLLGHHLLELSIRPLKLPKPLGFRYAHAAVLHFPAIERLLLAIVLAAHIGDLKS